MASEYYHHSDLQCQACLASFFSAFAGSNLSVSKYFITLSNAQDLVQAVKDMQIASAHTTKCTCSYTPPKDALDGTLTFYLLTFPTN
jgi:hypothetical protein